MEKIIVDTDIGSDCDDSGALAIFNAGINLGMCEGIATTYCLSSQNGAGAIDVINRFYNHCDIPIGSIKRQGYPVNSNDPFIDYLVREFPHRFKNGEECEDAVKVIRRSLAKSEDNSITFVFIGPLNNYKVLLESGADEFSELAGKDLFNKKVKRVCVMGGDFRAKSAKPEFNIASNISAAKLFFSECKVPIYIFPFELGEQIINGASLFVNPNPENPIYRCYSLYCGGERMSWDLCAVLFAMDPENKFWKISESGDVEVDINGFTIFTPKDDGFAKIVSVGVENDLIRDYIEELLSEKYTVSSL